MKAEHHAIDAILKRLMYSSGNEINGGDVLKMAHRFFYYVIEEEYIEIFVVCYKLVGDPQMWNMFCCTMLTKVRRRISIYRSAIS
jgi:hypothetical protein